MNLCRLCIIPDTRPDTEFVDGICSACIAYEKRKSIDWYARRAQFNELLARVKETARSRGNKYDCIVPSSGGKDSHYQVLTVMEHGLRPLVVTASTCHLTLIGRANIDNLKRFATTVESNNDTHVRARLNHIGLEMVGDISWPEHVAIFTFPFRVAKEIGIPFIFYGENPQNQYGGPLGTQEAKKMTRRWVSEFGGFNGLRPQDLIGMDGLTRDGMDFYILPPGAADGIEAHFLGQYFPWDSHANAKVAESNGMMQQLPSAANWWPHENLDNAQTGLHDYMMYRKYGYGRATAQLSVDVRAGLLTRTAALDLANRRDGLLPYPYCNVTLESMISKIGFSIDQLYEVIDRFTNWDLFSTSSGTIKIIAQKWASPSA